LNPLRYPMFAWQLASHKVCRWLVPFAMVTAAISNALLVASLEAQGADGARPIFYLVTLGLQLGFYVAAVVGLTGARALRIPAYFCLTNFAILAAWFRFARGERITTWKPSERLQALPRVSLH
jgi:hypothetical protein